MWTMLMDRMTGSRRSRPDTASFMDSQNDSADSGVEPGFGRIGVLTTGKGRADDTTGAGVEVRRDISAV